MERVALWFIILSELMAIMYNKKIHKKIPVHRAPRFNILYKLFNLMKRTQLSYLISPYPCIQRALYPHIF